MKKRIQNRLAESRFAFPVMIIYGLAVWLGAGTVAEGAYLQLAFFMASTLLMMMLNNTNSLIRIYSRMVSCSFVAMTCAATFLFSSLESCATGTCFILFYLSLLRSYQDKRAPGIAFYSFACLGIASLFFVQILYFVPFLWILMASNMMALTHRMFWATVLGLVMPYWFAVGYYVVTNQFDAFIDHFAELAQFEPLLQYEALDIHRIATFGLVVLLAVIGIIHYMRNSYQDKIRTRMIFEMFITVDIISFVFIILQPQHFDNLLPIIIVNTSCLFAHYVALTRTWLTNVTFIVMCLATLGLTIFNLMP